MGMVFHVGIGFRGDIEIPAPANIILFINIDNITHKTFKSEGKRCILQKNKLAL